MTVTGAGLSIPLYVCVFGYVCECLPMSVSSTILRFSYDYSLCWLGSTVNGIGESI